MQRSKLISLLKTLSLNEIRQFRDFVYSPYFNKEKVLMKLADYLADYHPEYDDEGIDKEKVFASLYPGKKYNDALMRNIISDFLKLANGFLLTLSLKRNEFRKDMLLLEELKIRKLTAHFLKHKERITETLELRPYEDEHYYDKKYEMSILYSGFLKEATDTYQRENQLYQDIADLLTTGFLIRILYHNTYLLTRESHISNFRFTFNLSDEIDIFFENNGKRYLEFPYINAYYLSFKLMQTQEEKYFYLLKDFLIKNFEILDLHKVKDILTVLTNYCYTKVTQGRDEFVKQQFELYKQTVEKSLHKGTVDYISNIFFISLVATGFEAGEAEWVEKFIEENIQDVKKNLRADTQFFCSALGHFWHNDLEKSLVELSKVTSEEFVFKQNIKSLMLKIYYELNETEPFYSHIDTYKHFILNNKNVHDKVRGQVNNFINYSKKLFNIRNKQDSDNGFEIRKTKKEISEHHALINKIWLLKKAEELVN
jgi:hypothetical protein